jgi:uncharacterized membrane protein
MKRFLAMKNLIKMGMIAGVLFAGSNFIIKKAAAAR